MAAFVRTCPYKLDDVVNEGKLRAVDFLYAEWQRCLTFFNQALLYLCQETGSMSKKLNYNQPPYRIITSLPTNTQTTMLHVISSQHASWNSNVAKPKPGPLAKLLMVHGLLDKDATQQNKLAAVEAFKHQLFGLNRYATRFLSCDKQCLLLQQIKRQHNQKFNAMRLSVELSDVVATESEYVVIRGYPVQAF